MLQVMPIMPRESNVDSVEKIEVIKVCSVFGEGIEGDPVRKLIEFFDLDGNLIARVDTFKVK